MFLTFLIRTLFLTGVVFEESLLPGSQLVELLFVVGVQTAGVSLGPRLGVVVGVGPAVVDGPLGLVLHQDSLDLRILVGFELKNQHKFF
jgi:hypothetical protein